MDQGRRSRENGEAEGLIPRRAYGKRDDEGHRSRSREPGIQGGPLPVFRAPEGDGARLPRDSPGRQAAWLITRYDDVAAALKDARLAKDRNTALTPDQAARQPWVPKMFRPLNRNMLDLDPPDHTRLRGLVQKAFTPLLIERMRERMASRTGELLDAALRRRRVDLIRDYALPIPTTIIAEMLGVPAADRHRFHRWSRVIVATSPSGPGMAKAIPSVFFFLRYIRRLVRARRAEPRDDLVSALAQAEEAGDELSEDELLAMIFLLVAGHETTVNLIGNGALALMRHPAQMERLRGGEPALVKTAVEELLRYESPLATATERFAREDIPIAGVVIPRGEMVYAVLPPPTATTANSRARTFSTSRANRTGTWRSAWRFTTASARRWPASRGRLRSPRLCAALRDCGSPFNRASCAGVAGWSFAGSNLSR
jgi:cytochrome P450